jgi:hypothetical protein
MYRHSRLKGLGILNTSNPTERNPITASKPQAVSMWLEVLRGFLQRTLGRRGRHLIRTAGDSPLGESFQNALRR